MVKRAPAFVLVVVVATASLGASPAWASDFGVGFGRDTWFSLDDTQIPFFGSAPGLSLIGRYALDSSAERAFVTTEVTVSHFDYPGYQDSDVPRLSYRGRALFGWRNGWRVPFDASVGVGAAVFPEELCNEPDAPLLGEDCSVALSVAPLPTFAIGTGFGGQGWEFNLSLRAESLNLSLQLGLIWW